MLGPYKIERYAKLPQRSKTATTGLGSIKTTWIRVYSASNRQLGLENGWPFRRFGGGATPPASPLSPLGALSHISHSLTDALPGCPRTPKISGRSWLIATPVIFYWAGQRVAQATLGSG